MCIQDVCLVIYTVMCKVFIVFFDCPVLPGPRHGLLLSFTLWEVVSSKAVQLQPVGALMAPLVGLVTGNVEVTRSFGAVT